MGDGDGPRGLTVGQLFASASHNEAVARISYAVQTRALAVLTGEVGAGKTVAARAAISALDSSRHHPIYLPNPIIGARGIHTAVVAALGGVPRSATLIPQAAEALAAEAEERGRTPRSW
jgi:type II secretory pathway predicted ATPase ExeA